MFYAWVASVIGALGLMAYCLKLNGTLGELRLWEIVPVVIIAGLYMAIHTLPW